MRNLRWLAAAAALLPGAVCVAAPAEGAEGMPVLRSGGYELSFWTDGNRKTASRGEVDPSLRPDVIALPAGRITFASDRDTLTLSPAVWESVDFAVVTEEGDSAFVRFTRESANPFEEPSPAMTKVAPSGLLSREQAEFDIRALVYSLSEIHPDIYSVCGQAAFHRAVNEAVKGLPDSVSVARLYLTAAPLVAMIGDGHTNLGFPFNNVFTEELRRRPYTVGVSSDRRMVCTWSIDGRIPEGSEIVAINGMSRDSILDSMLPYVAGEREHFRLSRLDGVYSGLDYLLYPADSYTVEFLAPGKKKTATVTYPTVTWQDIKDVAPRGKDSGRHPDYSYRIDEKAGVAVMDFRSFNNPERMGHFADSMFRELREKNIRDLVIDIRENGGGNSDLGDTLLRYVSPIPFTQFDKSLVRVTPVSARLMGSGATPGLYFFEADTTGYIRPRTPAEGRYDGRVWLLVSNYTFSSAADFSWAFKEAGCGTVIGEETGGMSVSYGDILVYRMPVSKLRATVSYKRFWQFRADENDIHGTLPDIEVPAADALDEALRRIRQSR